ncbi:MAG: hypothetical protein WCK67_10460 [bacterium]
MKLNIFLFINKKLFIIFLVLLLSAVVNSAVKAEDTNTNDDTKTKVENDWDDFYSQSRKNEFGKIISDEEFDKAYRTRKGLISKEEEKQKIKKMKYRAEHPSLLDKILGRKPQGIPLTSRATPPESIDYNISISPLLRLTQDMYYNGTKISNGFYLVDLVLKDGKYYFTLRQGTKSVITVDATVAKEPSTREKITLECAIVDGIILKIFYYQPRGLLIESELSFI